MTFIVWEDGWPTPEEWADLIPAKDMVPHLDQLTDLASSSNVVIEWGVRTGVSTVALLRGLPEDGSLLSVDSDPSVVSAAHPVMHQDPRFRLLIGSDLDLESEYPFQPDLVFIDSTHTYEHTRDELVICDRLEAKRIALHDYLYVHPNGYCRVQEAVDEFVSGGKYELEVLYPSDFGLAVLKRL